MLEAAVTSSIAHPNVVATYHYDITPVRQADLVGLRGLQISASPGMQLDWKLYLIQVSGTAVRAVQQYDETAVWVGWQYVCAAVQRYGCSTGGHGSTWGALRRVRSADVCPLVWGACCGWCCALCGLCRL